MLVCKGLPSEVDRLLAGTTENYYATVNTFARLQSLRAGVREEEDEDHG